MLRYWLACRGDTVLMVMGMDKHRSSKRHLRAPEGEIERVRAGEVRE